MPTQIEQGRIHFNLDGGRKRDREQWELTVVVPDNITEPFET
jgi:hypothetical protein